MMKIWNYGLLVVLLKEEEESKMQDYASFLIVTAIYTGCFDRPQTYLGTIRCSGLHGTKT